MAASSNATGLTTLQPVLPEAQPNVPLATSSWATTFVMPEGYPLIPKMREVAPWVDTPSDEAVRIMNMFDNNFHGNMRGSSLKIDG